MFADLAELSRARPPAGEGDAAEESVHSPREHFHHYLRSLDAEREGMPAALQRGARAGAAATTAWSDLARSPGAGRGGVPDLPRAGARSTSQFPAVAGLLDGRLRDADRCPRPLRKELRETLDRLVAATQLRHPGDRRARPQRALRGVRPATDRGGPRARPPQACATSSARIAADPDDAGAAALVDEVVAPPRSRCCRLLAERTSGGIAPRRADARDPDAALLQDPRPPRDLRIRAAGRPGPRDRRLRSSRPRRAAGDVPRRRSD